MAKPIDHESVDPLHVKHPEDGIIRRVDEHYDAQLDVEQDPHGAWLAIQNLCAALDEAREQIDAMEEGLTAVYLHGHMDGKKEARPMVEYGDHTPITVRGKTLPDTPIDRESVERLAYECKDAHECNDFPTGQDILEGAERTLLALRAALDAAEAEKQLAVTAALREAAEEIDCGCKGWCLHPHNCPKEDVDAVLALIPDAGKALDRALAEQRERMVNAVWEEYQDSVINKWTFRKEHVQNAMAYAAIRAQGET